MGPFNILALFTRNFETSKNSSSNVLIFVRLRWLHVNGTSKRTNFQQVKNSSGAVWTQPTETKGHCSKTCTRTYRSQVRGVSGSVGILRSNDATAPRTSKRSKTTTLHVHHAFFYISLPFLHDYDVKMSNFAFYGGRKQATTKFYFSYCLLYLDMVARNSTPGGFASIWQKWVGRNNCDKDWKNANSLFKRRSRYRRVVGS